MIFHDSISSGASLSAEKWLTDICRPLFVYSTPKVYQKWGAYQSFGDIWRIGNKIKIVPQRHYFIILLCILGTVFRGLFCLDLYITFIKVKIPLDDLFSHLLRIFVGKGGVL